MTYIKKTTLFAVTTIILVLITAFFISATVVCESSIDEQAQYQYQKNLEKEYVEELRVYLAGRGYHNSGVTLTSVTEADGSRTYTATIHHASIDRLDQTKRGELQLALAALPSSIGEPVFHEFLTLNY